MIFIAEDTINAIIANMEATNGELDEQISELKATQPMLLAYITSEQFDMLDAKERDYLFYLVQVVFQAISSTIKDLPELKEAQIGQAEETNWGLMEIAKGKTFRDRLDIFFEDYPQEDLLAFVEDALVEDEDSNITTEGRELILVGVKTLIDAFHAAA